MHNTLLIVFGLAFGYAVTQLCFIHHYLRQRERLARVFKDLAQAKRELPRVQHSSPACPEVRKAPENARLIYNILFLAPGLTTDSLLERLPAGLFKGDDRAQLRAISKYLLYYARTGRYFRIVKADHIGEQNHYFVITDKS